MVQAVGWPTNLLADVVVFLEQSGIGGRRLYVGGCITVASTWRERGRRLGWKAQSAVVVRRKRRFRKCVCRGRTVTEGGDEDDECAGAREEECMVVLSIGAIAVATGMGKRADEAGAVDADAVRRNGTAEGLDGRGRVDWLLAWCWGLSTRDGRSEECKQNASRR